MRSKSTYSAPLLLLFLFSLQEELHCSSIVTYKNSHHPPTLTEAISFPDYLKCSIATIIILWWYFLYWQAQSFLTTKTLHNQDTIFLHLDVNFVENKGINWLCHIFQFTDNVFISFQFSNQLLSAMLYFQLTFMPFCVGSVWNYCPINN